MAGFIRGLVGALVLGLGLLPQCVSADGPAIRQFSAFTEATLVGVETSAGEPCVLPIFGVAASGTCGLSFSLHGDSTVSTEPSHVILSVNYTDPIGYGRAVLVRGGLWSETTVGGSTIVGQVLGGLSWPASPTSDDGCGPGVARISVAQGMVPFSVERQVLNACWSWNPHTTHVEVAGSIVAVPYVRLVSTADSSATNQYTSEAAIVPPRYTTPGLLNPPELTFGLDTSLVSASVSLTVVGWYSLDNGSTWLNFTGGTTMGGVFTDKNGISLRTPAIGGGVPPSSTAELVRITVIASAPIPPPTIEGVIETFS